MNSPVHPAPPARRSNQIALIVTDVVTLHYPEVLSELSRQFALQGRRLVLFTLVNDGGLDLMLDTLWQHPLDGAVIAARVSPRQAAQLEQRAIPFVLFTGCVPDQGVNAVVCDQVEAARKLVTRLAAAGHKRFAMIDGPRDSRMAQERSRGVTTRLLEIGLAAPLVVSGSYDYASGGRGLREIVARLGGIPDVIICGNDVTAIGCLDAARHDMKLAVPQTLSITGFDGVAQASWLSYNLTTLRQPVQAMTAAASQMLGELIGDASAGPERRMFCASVVEGSTARLGPAF